MQLVSKFTFIVICSVLLYINLAAQPYSYIYIQGDKTTPFYVKLDGKMQPRYCKNYCIISSLSAGTANIEILFQQNAYPAEKFMIEVGENDTRGFLLDKRGQGFALYDLQKKKYIEPGNTATK